MKDPKYGDNKGTDPNDERANGDQRVVRVVVRRAILEIFDVLFQHVNRLLELEEGFLFLLSLLPGTAAAPSALATKAKETAPSATSVVGHLLLLPFDFEELANVHELVDALPNGHLRLGELHGIHVAGTVDKVHDEIQRHRSDTNTAEQGKEEPSYKGHETSKEGTKADLNHDTAHLLKFVVALEDNAVAPSHGLELVGLEGEDLRCVGYVVDGDGLVGEELGGGSVVLVFPDGDVGIAEKVVGEEEDEDNNDQSGKLPLEGIPDAGFLLGIAPSGGVGSGHEHAIIGLVVEGGEGDEQEHVGGDEPEEDVPEEGHVEPAADSGVVSVASGISLVVGNVERKEEDRGAGHNEAGPNDQLGEPRLILVVGMLILDQHIKSHDGQYYERHKNGNDEEPVRLHRHCDTRSSVSLLLSLAFI
mmetsp:Transcript_16710/g.47978  ORF Transcript_16710/g.47978 Transcript_16710/m.47978 type:complete len:418 (+) Transcript_16710:534-1787(+)